MPSIRADRADLVPCPARARTLRARSAGPGMNRGGEATMRFARKSSPVVPAGRELPSSGSITTLNESGIRSSPRRDMLRDTDAMRPLCSVVLGTYPKFAVREFRVSPH
jgi:hypothetical protein